MVIATIARRAMRAALATVLLAATESALPAVPTAAPVAANAPATTAATASAGVWLEDLTWTELRDRVAAGATTVIIPVGGIEQSGPQIALGKHNARVKVLAERIARELGDTLVAPVIAYVPEGAIDPPTQHMKFPGTITVPEATFEKTLEYAARSLARAGFRDIVLIGDHGGYQKNLVAVAARLNREWAAGPTRVHAITEYYRAAEDGYAQALRRNGYTSDEIGSHAGAADTSLTLALAPAMVRAGPPASDPKIRGSEGVHGDPRRATAAIGEVGADLIVAQSVAAIKRAIAAHKR